jgi:hypothetical protein
MTRVSKSHVGAQKNPAETLAYRGGAGTEKRQTSPYPTPKHVASVFCRKSENVGEAGGLVSATADLRSGGLVAWYLWWLGPDNQTQDHQTQCRPRGDRFALPVVDCDMRLGYRNVLALGNFDA